MSTTGIKYDIDTALGTSPGEWIADYFTVKTSDRRLVIADVCATEQHPPIAEFKANGLLIAASKDLAQAALSAEAAISAHLRDPELVIDWDAVLRELNHALTKAGHPGFQESNGE